MKKYLPMLEQNVQWIALGIGAMFLLYMVWANVLTAPADVELNGEMLSPAKVDEQIISLVINDLEGKVNSTAVPRVLLEPAPRIAVEAAPVNVQPLVATAFPNLSIPVTEPGVPGGEVNPQQPGPGGIQNVVVDRLPKLGKPTDVVAAFNRAAVDRTIKVGMQPPQPLPTGEDIEYVSVKFTVPMGDIAREFVATHIPPALMTTFLKVDLVREELDGEGNWINETIVGPLKNLDIQPMPGADAQPAQFLGYFVWAEANQPIIVQPPFYTVTKGTAWQLPGAPVVDMGGGAAWVRNENEVRPGFNPDSPPPDPTMKEKQEIYKRNQEKKREEQRNRAPARPATPGGRPGRPGPSDGAEFSSPAENREITVRHFQISAEDEMGPGYNPGYNPGMQTTGVNAPPPPAAAFDPRLINMPELTGWAHDETVKPGKTYRYKVRYSMKNPIFGAKNLAKDPTLANQVAIVSEDSDWTRNIEIPERTRFYITVANSDIQTVEFEIFTFSAGQLTREKFKMAAGDMVGGMDKNGVKYETGYTVMDVRRDRSGSDLVVVLADADGNLSYRSRRKDELDENRKNMNAQINAALVPPGAQPGAPGGGGVGEPNF